MSRARGETDESCLNAVMAAQEVLTEECGGNRTILNLTKDMMAAVPQEVRDRGRDMDMDSTSRRELESLLDEEEWLNEWTAAMCRQSGLSEGSEEFETCRRNWTRRVLG